jgi:hypothetical protein
MGMDYYPTSNSESRRWANIRPRQHYVAPWSNFCLQVSSQWWGLNLSVGYSIRYDVPAQPHTYCTHDVGRYSQVVTATDLNHSGNIWSSMRAQVQILLVSSCSLDGGIRERIFLFWCFSFARKVIKFVGLVGYSALSRQVGSKSHVWEGTHICDWSKRLAATNQRFSTGRS